MALYNFQKRFAAAVERGDKTHTIRAKRKRATKVGETVYLYTGLRQKGSRKLLESTCTRVQEITIETREYRTEYRDGDWWIFAYPTITVDGEVLADDEMEALARRDGFADLFEMMSFWPEDRRPFSGDLIHWRSPKAVS